MGCVVKVRRRLKRKSMHYRRPSMRARAALFLSLLLAGCVEAGARPVPVVQSPAPKPEEVVLPNGERFGSCPPRTVLRGFPLLKDAGATYCVTEAEPAQRQGPFVSFFPSGKLLARGEYAEGNPEGLWTTYHESGQVLSQGSYVHGIRDGQWKFGRDDGKPVLEEGLSAGTRVSWIDYEYEKGELRGFESFILDERKRPLSQGRAGQVRDNGNVLSGQFERGKGQGVWEEKTAKGLVVMRVTLRAGFVEGAAEMAWPDTGKPAATGELVKTLPQGAWTLYYRTGEKRAELKYEKGLLRSLVVYYPDGKRQLAGEFLDGVPHSAWSTYHANGALQTSGSYARGIRQGMWRTADDSGKPIFEGSYADGLLTEGQKVEPIVWAGLGLGDSLVSLFQDLAFITAGRGAVESEQRSLAECLLFGDPAEKCRSLDWENFRSFHASDGAPEIDRRNKLQDLACAMNNPAACARVGKRLLEAAPATDKAAPAKDKKTAASKAAGYYQKACDLAPLESAWKRREPSAKNIAKDFHSASACVWLGRMLDAGEVKSKALVAADLYKRACEMEIAEGCAAMTEAHPKKKP
jgi:antitoxin component YwqK of YwqJK toxin-antitoxin module